MISRNLNPDYCTYNPQDSIFTAYSITEDTIIDYSAEAIFNNISTNFMFYKNNELVETNTTGIFATTGIGVYNCKMTNSFFENVVLTTSSITFLPVLSIFPSTLTINSANCDDSLKIISNTDWSVVSSDIWLTINPSSGTNNETITLTATANPTTSVRTAIITVSGTGITDQTITVTQNASATGINDINKNPVIMFPNPITNELTINGLIENATISLFDLNGKLLINRIAKSESEKIDVSSITKGVYLIKVTDKKVIQTSKLIKQ